MDEEIASLQNNNTHILVKKLGNKRTMVVSGFSELKKALQLVNLGGINLGLWLKGILRGKELILKSCSPLWLDMLP